MMERDYAAAGRGLRLLFLGEIVSLGSLIPNQAVGLLSDLASMGLMLYGLNLMVNVHKGYRTALVVSLFSLALSIFTYVAALQDPVVSGTILVVGMLIGIVRIYLICVTTAVLLEEKKRETLAKRGAFIWKLTVGGTMVMAISMLLAQLMESFALIILFLGSVAVLVASIQFIKFLWDSAGVLMTQQISPEP